MLSPEFTGTLPSTEIGVDIALLKRHEMHYCCDDSAEDPRLFYMDRPTFSDNKQFRLDSKHLEAST